MAVIAHLEFRLHRYMFSEQQYGDVCILVTFDIDFKLTEFTYFESSLHLILLIKNLFLN